MSVKLYAFTCGRLTGEFARLMEGGEGEITVPVPVDLIEHPKGRALFDTGLHSDCQHDPAGRLGEHMTRQFRIGFPPGEEISARLEGIDRDPGKIDLVVTNPNSGKACRKRPTSSHKFQDGTSAQNGQRARTTGYFQHGELSWRIYEAFRDQEWVTAAEIADKAMRDKRLSDKSIRAIFIANFLVRLGQLQRRGKLEKASGRGGSVRWKLAGA